MSPSRNLNISRIHKMSNRPPSRLSSQEAAALLRTLYDIRDRTGTSPDGTSVERARQVGPSRHNSMPPPNLPSSPNNPNSGNRTNTTTASQRATSDPHRAHLVQSAPTPSPNHPSAATPQNLYFNITEAQRTMPTTHTLPMTVTHEGSTITLDATTRLHGHLNALSIPSPTLILNQAENLTDVLRTCLNEPQPSAPPAAESTIPSDPHHSNRAINLHINSSIQVVGSRNQIVMSSSGNPPPITMAPIPAYNPAQPGLAQPQNPPASAPPFATSGAHLPPLQFARPQATQGRSFSAPEGTATNAPTTTGAAATVPAPFSSIASVLDTSPGMEMNSLASRSDISTVANLFPATSTAGGGSVSTPPTSPGTLIPGPGEGKIERQRSTSGRSAEESPEGSPPPKKARTDELGGEEGEGAI